MYFCDDVDLLVWEPGIFGAVAFGHQCLVKAAAGTLTGTTLTLATGALAAAAAGMVVIADSGGGMVQLLEIVELADNAHAIVSALRGGTQEPAIPPLAGGSVSVTMMTFRPQIAGVGDELLTLLGVASDRARSGEAPPCAINFRMACVFGSLARIFGVLAEAAEAPQSTAARRDFYLKMFDEARRTVGGTIDHQQRQAAVGELVRT